MLAYEASDTMCASGFVAFSSTSLGSLSPIAFLFKLENDFPLSHHITSHNWIFFPRMFLNKLEQKANNWEKYNLKEGQSWNVLL